MGGRIKRKDRDELARQRLLERAAQASGIVQERHFPRFELADFNALKLGRESVDLLLTDPPYKGKFLHLWKELGVFAAHVLKPEGFLVAYLGSYHFDEEYEGLRAAGLHTRWIMGVKHRHGSPTVHQAGFSNSLKPILVLGKGKKRNRPKNAPVDDFLWLGEGDGKSRHPWGQDFAEAERIVLGFTDPDDLVCDPFAGGGTVPLAAMLNGRRVVASEIDRLTHADAARLIGDAYDAATEAEGEVRLLHDELPRDEEPLRDEGCGGVVEAVVSGFDAA
jgi:hypothetical protein